MMINLNAGHKRLQQRGGGGFYPNGCGTLAGIRASYTPASHRSNSDGHSTTTTKLAAQINCQGI